MDNNYLNDPRLQQAATQASQAAGPANASAQADVSLPQMLKETLNAKFNDNNPLVQDRNNAATAYLSSIPSSQNDVLPQNNGGVILSPTQQAMMIQSKQNAYLSPLMEKNSMLASQRGSLADVIQGVTQAHKASTDALVQKASLAHQSYKDILDELSTKADQAYKLKSLGETMRHNKADEANQALMAANRYRMLTPAQQIKQQQSIEPFTSALQLVQNAKDKLSKVQTGPQHSLYDIRSKLPQGFGGYDEGTNQALSDLTAANTALFKIAGTQFTKGEKDLLGPNVVGITNDTKRNQAALDTYQRLTNNHLAGILGINPKVLLGARKGKNKDGSKVSEDDITNYLYNQLPY